MKIQLAMIKKEMYELLKSYKWIVIPIAFMFLGALQPITYYYLPDILKMSTLPEGAILEIPTPSPAETMSAVYGQFTQLGLLFLILVSMGAIANEVKHGVAETILVKPVSSKQYLFSKWIAYSLLATVSIFVGILAGYFYTLELIGEIEFALVMKSMLVYLIFLLFFVGMSLFLSSIMKSSIVAGGITFFSAIMLGIISSLPFKLWYIPTYLLTISQQMLNHIPPENLWLSVGSTIFYIVIMFFVSVQLFKNKSFS